jgi:tripartite-type tricarboxylate transporter receptor subunit TctC
MHWSNSFYGVLLVALFLLCGPALAQTFPVKPIRIVLGLPQGSAPDVVTRILADKMADDLGQPVLVENRPGAGGTIAVEAVVRAPGDGYTLIVDGCSAAGIVYAFVMTGRPPLDPLKDFTPIGRLIRDHWVIAVSPELGVDSLAALIALGKSKPGSLTFPSPGTGSSPHLQSERFLRRAGFEATHVPYKDNPMPDLIAGRTSFAVVSSAGAASLIKSGKLKGLAVLSTERMTSLPHVPTSAETGMPDLIYNAGVCLYAPGATARDVVTRLNAALNRAEQHETVHSRFAQLGVEPVQGSPEEAARYIRALMADVDALRLTVFGKAR